MDGPGRRQAESEVCRAAVMAGMLFSRLNSTDAAGDAVGRPGRRGPPAGVTWHVDDDWGAVTFRGLDAAAPVPWCRSRRGRPGARCSRGPL